MPTIRVVTVASALWYDRASCEHPRLFVRPLLDKLAVYNVPAVPVLGIVPVFVGTEQQVQDYLNKWVEGKV